MRSPNLNIGPPRINPNIAGRVNPMAAADQSERRTCRFPHRRSRIGVRLHPYLRYSPNLYPLCDDVSGDAHADQPAASADGGGGARGRSTDAAVRAAAARRPRSTSAPSPIEIVAEIDGSLSPAQADELARRHGLARLQSQNFPLIGAHHRPVPRHRPPLGRGREPRICHRGRRSLGAAEFPLCAAGAEGQSRAEGRSRRNMRWQNFGCRRRTSSAEGADVRVAVIDSGIDVKHPELAGSIAGLLRCARQQEGPHVHGTGVAGAIVAHATVEGSAPAAKIIAIRAFGVVQNGAESTSFVLLKSFDYAASHSAQIINMSFAGPKDALIERGIAAMAAKGIVMVAAAGNAGPKSPPLYPGANPNVIAVSGTDAQDRLFAASNRGDYIAVAAPGAEYLPAGAGRQIPDDVGHLVLGGLCQRHRGAGAGAQSRVEA